MKDYKIVWLGGFELSEVQKAQIALNFAQARLNKLNWMTIDEIRAEQDLQPLANGAGQVVLGIENSSRHFLPLSITQDSRFQG